jgi:hypothetical protein
LFHRNLTTVRIVPGRIFPLGNHFLPLRYASVGGIGWIQYRWNDRGTRGGARFVPFGPGENVRAGAAVVAAFARLRRNVIDTNRVHE